MIQKVLKHLHEEHTSSPQVLYKLSNFCELHNIELACTSKKPFSQKCQRIFHEQLVMNEHDKQKCRVLEKERIHRWHFKLKYSSLG